MTVVPLVTITVPLVIRIHRLVTIVPLETRIRRVTITRIRLVIVPQDTITGVVPLGWVITGIVVALVVTIIVVVVGIPSSVIVRVRRVVVGIPLVVVVVVRAAVLRTNVVVGIPSVVVDAQSTPIMSIIVRARIAIIVHGSIPVVN